MQITILIFGYGLAFMSSDMIGNQRVCERITEVWLKVLPQIASRLTVGISIE
jgi:hypothetical protein